MATITFCGESFTVDHAVKGADYVHGYDADGNLVISLDGVSDFSGITYDGTYISPAVSFAEACNDVKFCDGILKTRDGAAIGATALQALFAAGYTVISDKQCGPEFPTDAPDGTIFFKEVN